MEQRERVLSKDERLKTVWPDTFVDESNLSQQIFMLRRTLNGDSDGAEYIGTVPRRGYRFVADAIEQPVAPTAIADAVNGHPMGGRWIRTAALAACAVLIGGVFAAVLWRRWESDIMVADGIR